MSFSCNFISYHILCKLLFCLIYLFSRFFSLFISILFNFISDVIGFPCILKKPLLLCQIRYPASPPDKVYPSGKEANSEHSSDVHDESVQPIMTYSLLDQSMVNWQNIQEWAQKQWVKRQHSVRSSNSSIKTSPASPDSPPTTHTPPANPVVHNLKKGGLSPSFCIHLPPANSVLQNVTKGWLNPDFPFTSHQPYPPLY